MWLCIFCGWSFCWKSACSFSPRVLIQGTSFCETIYSISLGLQCLELGLLKPTPFNYFIDDFVLKIDYNSAKTWQAKSPSSRPSKDTFIKHILSLELSVRLKSELRKLHADFGSGLIGLCHNTNKVQNKSFFGRHCRCPQLVGNCLYLVAEKWSIDFNTHSSSLANPIRWNWVIDSFTLHTCTQKQKK